MPTNLSNLKSKVDKLDVDKLVPVPVDLSKLGDVYNAKIKNVEDKIPDNTKLASNTTLKAKTNEVPNEIRSITNLATTAALNVKTNEVKNELPNITNSATTTAFTAAANKMPDHRKYITSPEFN